MTGKQVCQAKKFYRNENSAWDVAFFFYSKFGTYGTPYLCNHCSRYHLTSKYPSLPSPQFMRKMNKWFGIDIFEMLDGSDDMSHTSAGQ